MPSWHPLTRMPPALRHRGCAWRHTPAPGHGQPLADAAKTTRYRVSRKRHGVSSTAAPRGTTACRAAGRDARATQWPAAAEGRSSPRPRRRSPRGRRSPAARRSQGHREAGSWACPATGPAWLTTRLVPSWGQRQPAERLRAPGCGSGLPMPRRRTFADALVASAHSDAAGASPSWLRLAAYAGSRGTGNPELRSDSRKRPGVSRPASRRWMTSRLAQQPARHVA